MIVPVYIKTFVKDNNVKYLLTVIDKEKKTILYKYFVDDIDDIISVELIIGNNKFNALILKDFVSCVNNTFQFVGRLVNFV